MAAVGLTQQTPTEYSDDHKIEYLSSLIAAWWRKGRGADGLLYPRSAMAAAIRLGRPERGVHTDARSAGPRPRLPVVRGPRPAMSPPTRTLRCDIASSMRQPQLTSTTDTLEKSRRLRGPEEVPGPLGSCLHVAATTCGTDGGAELTHPAA